jgi:puromycin-sensitive aminopeptidase
MLSNWIGFDKLKEGLHLYLKRFSYKNTITSDLWTCFEEVSNKPVNEVMSYWTKQKGFPLLTIVEEEIENDKEHTNLHIKQEKFYNIDLKDTFEDYFWQIPITIKIDDELINFLLTKKEDFIKIKKNKFLKLNIEHSGFYRIDYSNNILEKIKNGIENKLSPTDRLCVLSDLFAQVTKRNKPIDTYFSVLMKYKNEKDYSVWSEISSTIRYLNNIIENEKYYSNFKNFVNSLYFDLYLELGWNKLENENPLNTLLRSLVISILAMTDNKTVIEDALNVDKSKLENDLKEIVEGIMIKYDENNKNFNDTLKIFQSMETNEIKDRALYSLCQTKNQKNIEYILGLVLTDEIRVQDIFKPFIGFSSNKLSRDLSWKVIIYLNF